MKRKTKRKLLSVLAGAAAVLVLFAARFFAWIIPGRFFYIYSIGSCKT